MPPLLGGAEVAAVARLERGDAVGEQRPAVRWPAPAADRARRGGQPLVDDRAARSAGWRRAWTGRRSGRARGGSAGRTSRRRRRRAGCPTAAAARPRCDAARPGRRAGRASGRTRAGRARPASGSASTLMRDRDGEAGEQQHRQRGVFVGDGHADEHLPAEEHGDDDAAGERPQHVGAQRLPLVERIPQRDRDAEQQHVETRWTPTPASSAPGRAESPGSRCPARRTAWRRRPTPVTERGPCVRPSSACTIAPSVASEIDGEHHPVPGAQRTVDRARHRRATQGECGDDGDRRQISPTRPRHVSPGRVSSSSTANHATPGTTTR